MNLIISLQHVLIFLGKQLDGLSISHDSRWLIIVVKILTTRAMEFTC